VVVALKWSMEVKSSRKEMERAVVGLKGCNYIISHGDCFFVCVRLKQD
jgi:hypothetical protein